MKKYEKNLGWIALIILGVVVAVLCYLFVPMPFSTGAVIFAVVSFFVILGYHTFVEVEEDTDSKE